MSDRERSKGCDFVSLSPFQGFVLYHSTGTGAIFVLTRCSVSPMRQLFVGVLSYLMVDSGF